MNTFGHKLRLTTFGESHGVAMGGVIDGFPAGFKVNLEKLQSELDKRRPGTSLFVTQRNEPDKPEFLSGLSTDGITLGTPIGFIIRNSDTRSSDYSNMAQAYRPNHADYTYDAKYGLRDYRGGGRASARETVNWVVAGALANQWLETSGIEIKSFLSAVGRLSYKDDIVKQLTKGIKTGSMLSLPEDATKKMEAEIIKAKNKGDSIGGIVTCMITGIPAGIGDPIFNKLQAALAQAMLSINAAKGFEYGEGFNSAYCNGSEILDIFEYRDNKITTKTNHSGGIQGGISNGMPVFFNVAFKPTPTILKELTTINSKGETISLKAKGRHDPCVAVRAVPVVKALTSLVVADFLL